ncbi:hexokinase family protein [Planctomycetota bacterium]
MVNSDMNVTHFLKKYNMNSDQIDIDDCCNVFLKEMEQGLAGHDSTLAMIPTYMETEKNVPTGKPVVVMDAGGTNFRVATVYFNTDNNKDVIENFHMYKMPGVEKEVGREEFFNIMAEYVSGIAHKSSNIGFCFSYPTEIFPDKDGKLIRFSKEIKAKEVEGRMIGENLNAALAKAGHKNPKHVVILNDTVTTLLAGRAASFSKSYSSYIGFILGTGTNCAYIESNSKIKKRPDLNPAKSQIINIESGGFGKAPMGIIDKKFDASTTNPGEYTFEKMISGAYLGPLILMTLQQASEDGFFSKITCQRLKDIAQLSTIDINNFLCDPKSTGNPLSALLLNHPDEHANADLEKMFDLVKKMVARSAKLTAINLSSVVLKSGKGKDPEHPVCITAEGTTFFRFNGFQSNVESYLEEYLVKQKKRYYEIRSVENATLIGAAIAGLTN